MSILVDDTILWISGNCKGVEQVFFHLAYVSGQGETELETEQGEVVRGKEIVGQLAKDWIEDGGKRRQNTRDTTNIVLSLPAGTDAREFKAVVRSFAKTLFGDYHQYVMAQHSDADHSYIHLTVKNLGFDGRRLHIKKGDLRKWRKLLAEHLSFKGII